MLVLKPPREVREPGAAKGIKFQHKMQDLRHNERREEYRRHGEYLLVIGLQDDSFDSSWWSGPQTTYYTDIETVDVHGDLYVLKYYKRKNNWSCIFNFYDVMPK